MSLFSKWCSLAVGTAQGDPNYIGAVCRFNGDDDLMVWVRNDEYGKPPSLPVMSTPWAKPEAEHLVRIQSVRALLMREREPLFETTEEREVHYWQGIHQAIDTGESDYSMEAMSLYRSTYVPAGLVGEEWMQAAERKVRQERLDATRVKLQHAQDARKHADIKIAAARRLFLEDTETEYRKLHGNATPYPREYVLDAQMPPGAHAEENLIRIWNSITQTLQLQHVEIFITRKPCPDKSSGFSMGGVVYKEGCMNKLIQLVGQVDSGVRWKITYFQGLKNEQEALANAFATGFPANVTLELWGEQQ